MKNLHPLDDPQSREASISLRTEVRHDYSQEADGASDHVLDLHYKVFAEWSPEGSYENCYEVEAGEVHLRLVRLSVAVDEETPLAELFDFDQSLTNLGRLYDWRAVNLEFIDSVLKVCEIANSFSDLFSIESMFLHPWARRQGLGLRIIEVLLRKWQSGCSLAVIEPSPLAEDGVDPSEGVFKLTRYFNQLGFMKVRDSPYLVRPIELMPPNTANVDLPEFLLVPSGLAEAAEK